MNQDDYMGLVERTARETDKAISKLLGGMTFETRCGTLSVNGSFFLEPIGQTKETRQIRKLAEAVLTKRFKKVGKFLANAAEGGLYEAGMKANSADEFIATYQITLELKFVCHRDGLNKSWTEDKIWTAIDFSNYNENDYDLGNGGFGRRNRLPKSDELNDTLVEGWFQMVKGAISICGNACK